MLRISSVITLCLLLSACNVKTEIIRSGDSYTIKSKRNALVVFKNKSTGEQFMIDNRGKPWYLELVIAQLLGDTKKSVHVELDNLDATEVDN